MSSAISGVYLDDARLRELIATIPGKAEAIVHAGAVAVEGRAVTLAPVDTGALVNSIQNWPLSKYLYAVGPNVEYAIYQEFGTHRMRAHPFLRPALEWAKPQFLKRWPGLFK